MENCHDKTKPTLDDDSLWGARVKVDLMIERFFTAVHTSGGGRVTSRREMERQTHSRYMRTRQEMHVHARLVCAGKFLQF